MCFWCLETTLRVRLTAFYAPKTPRKRGACGDLDGASPPNEDLMTTTDRCALSFVAINLTRIPWWDACSGKGSPLEPTRRATGTAKAVRLSWRRPALPAWAVVERAGKGAAFGNREEPPSSFETWSTLRGWNARERLPVQSPPRNVLGCVGSRKEGGR